MRERMVNSARELMWSQQDGSYLVEFIHGGNMLSQVILLTSGPHSNARHKSPPRSPKTRFRGCFSWGGKRVVPDFQKLNVPGQNYACAKSTRFRSLCQFERCHQRLRPVFYGPNWFKIRRLSLGVCLGPFLACMVVAMPAARCCFS